MSYGFASDRLKYSSEPRVLSEDQESSEEEINETEEERGMCLH